MRVIARAHARTRATSLRCVKNSTVCDTYCLGHWNEKNERKIKRIKLNNLSFFFNLCYTFVCSNVVLQCTV